MGVEMEGCPGSQLEHLEGLAGMVVCMDSSNLQDLRVPQEVWSLPLNHTYLKLENTQVGVGKLHAEVGNMGGYRTNV